MKIQLDKLCQGEHRFECQLDPADLELDPQHFVDPVNVALTWDRRDPNIRLKFEVTARRKSICDRCLLDMVLKVEGETDLLIQLREQASEDSDDPDFKLVSPSEREIDFTADIRDAIMLAVPTKILCTEDCKGLCPICGADLNQTECCCPTEVVNTQWDALLKLKKTRKNTSRNMRK
jgi:uncharacterized protein